MFSGFTSRWKTPLRCMWSMATPANQASNHESLIRNQSSTNFDIPSLAIENSCSGAPPFTSWYTKLFILSSGKWLRRSWISSKTFISINSKIKHNFLEGGSLQNSPYTLISSNRSITWEAQEGYSTYCQFFLVESQTCTIICYNVPLSLTGQLKHDTVASKTQNLEF
jgi:hypothetical protein